MMLVPSRLILEEEDEEEKEGDDEDDKDEDKDEDDKNDEEEEFTEEFVLNCLAKQPFAVTKLFSEYANSPDWAYASDKKCLSLLFSLHK